MDWSLSKLITYEMPRSGHRFGPRVGRQRAEAKGKRGVRGVRAPLCASKSSRYKGATAGLRPVDPPSARATDTRGAVNGQRETPISRGRR